MPTPDIKVKITAQGPGAADEAVAKAGGRKLATAAAAGLSPIQKLAQGIAKMDTREATRGVFALRTGLTQLAGQAIGTQGPIARLGEAVLGFGSGGAVTLAVLGGLAALGAAWRQFGKDMRDAKKAADQASATLLSLQLAKGPNVAAAEKVKAVADQLQQDRAKLDAMQQRRELEAEQLSARSGVRVAPAAPGAAERILALAVQQDQQALNMAQDALAKSQQGLAKDKSGAAGGARDPEKAKMQVLATATAVDQLRSRLLLEGKSLDEVADAAERARLKLQGLSDAQANNRIASERAAKAAHDEAEMLTRFATATARRPTLAGGLRLHMAHPTAVATAGSSQEELQDRLVASGLDPDEARKRAAAAFGGGAGGGGTADVLSMLAGGVGGGAGQALSVGTGVAGLVAAEARRRDMISRLTATGLSADSAKSAAGASPFTAAALIPLALPLFGGLLSGLFGQKSVTIDGYSPTALAQMKESSGAGTLVAINAVGGDPRTTEYQIDRQQRRDDIVRIPTTRPGAGS